MVERFIKMFFKNKQVFLLAFLATIIPMTSIAFTYGAIKTHNVTTVTPGVNGDTVYVDDQNADYYYYTGQNYTHSSDGSIPTTTDKNIYNDDNLVHTIITYHGKGYNSNNVGYVSLTERQSKFVYYKFYPVENGYINIELIDNPFNDHPGKLVFNGWKTDYRGAVISYDSVYYTRYVKVPVTSNNGSYADVNINIYADWTEGSTAFVNSSSSFSDINSSLKSVGMNQINSIENVYDYPSVEGYYRSETITTTTTVSWSGWNQQVSTENGTCTDCYTSNGTHYNNYTCPAPDIGYYAWAGTYTNDCVVYYLLGPDDEYEQGHTYYTLRNGQMVNANLNAVVVGTRVSDLYNNANMSGYYRKKSISRGNSLNGYYNDQGVLQSGNCKSRTCNVYELIQFYKQDNSQEIFDQNQTYYYLTTRDTNIVVMSGDYSNTWSDSFTKPFTLTGIYNQHDYNPTWSVRYNSVIAYSDLRIEQLTIDAHANNSNSEPSNSNSSSGTFIGNYHNVKLGRNIKQNDDYVNFKSVIGGYNSNSTSGSTSNPKKYRFVIESGNYNSTSLSYGATTSSYYSGTLYTEMQGIYGNDYDKATVTNDNLTIYYCASGSWSGAIHSSDDTLIPAFTTTVKSGSFGTSKYDLTTGIYVGGRYEGTQYSPRVAKIEGGYIYNLIGGPLSSSNHSNINDIYIYMTGGEVDMIVGGAGTSTTYGNRIIQVTGGTVNYSVFGGSNGYDGNSTDGTLTGDSYVYIGGVATIGNDDYITDENTLYGAESGSVFGAGNGNSDYPSIGSVNNSYMVVNDKANIKKNVYGSGNYGTVGYSSTNSTGVTNINVINGVVNGSVFASGNNSGSGSSSVTINPTINIKGGQVVNGVYGGSNQAGTLYGDTTINVTGGTLKDVYGGGLGEDTYVSKNVTINIDNTDSALTITGSVYGGSAYGTVNSTTHSTSVSQYNTVVNVNNGTIANVFGGGQGDDNHTPYVCGNATVNIHGGTITNVFGGNDAAGQPNGDVNVYLTGGTITNVYGGGNNTGVDETNVYQQGANATNIFGGSNASGDVSTSNVVLSAGTTGTVYGGNNSGGITNVSNVLLSGGNVSTLYGGGKEASTDSTHVNVTGGTVDTVYGGGQQAGITTGTVVNVTGGNVDTVYGGSNVSGDVAQTQVTINSGSINEVYGGNNQNGVSNQTYVYLNGGSVTNVYGGGNKTSTITSDVRLNGSTVANIYGGGNQAGVTTTNVKLITGRADSVYGGSNNSGNVNTSNITSNHPSNLSVTNVYGGNNNGGVTGNANVTLVGGNYTNIYGGGNKALTDNTKVDVNDITVSGQLFGGGNQAGVNNYTDVDFKNSTINGDLFGGGNLGVVSGSTNVYVSNSHIGGSAYAGGNGATATVLGNTRIDVDNGSVIAHHVFGGGNAANTGIIDDGDSTTTNDNNSTSMVNIAGGTIHGNVYGGANTAVIYGRTYVNVGYNANSLNKSDIQIDGTVFGGGEANAAGSEEYDFNFINVTVGTDVHIDGQGYNNFNIDGSIFGSGNAANCSGYKYIEIDNYGTFDNYKSNISIQRADKLIIKNSAIKLEGATDRTNEYNTVKFSLSRIDELKLANNSTLFLANGTNLVKEFKSLLIENGTDTKATVNITSSGETTRNVNNRIYMLEGKNMNVATNQAVTDYGRVSGMTFLGMYQLDRNGKVVTAMYNNSYDNGDTVEPGELYTFTLGSYVAGLHSTNHQIKKDGFYSNFADEDHDGAIKVDYIQPTPSDADFYMWVVGEEITTYNLTLTASKYSTLGTVELPMIYSNGANTTYEIVGFNYQNLEDGFSLVDPSQISRVNTEGTADTKMGLAFESPETGFISGGKTTFLSNESTPITGTKDYVTENSSNTHSFLFYLYHSKNLTVAREVGTAVITLLAIKPIDDLNNEVSRININVTINTALYDTNDYEGAMSPGEKYGLFASTPTNITTKSTLSAYYSLYMDSASPYYKAGYHHSLVSDYILPVGTKITMIDFTNEPVYYYYVVDQAAVTAATNEFNLYGECSYNLSNFIAMGSTSSNNNYNESENNNRYYNDDLDLVEEEFIFNIDFGDTNITGNQLEKSLVMELRNGNDQVLVGVLGIQHSNLTYSLYDRQSAIIDIDGSLEPNKIYLKDSAILDLTAEFTQPTVGSLPVIDTTYLNKRMGIRLTIYDGHNELLNNSSLFGLSYTINGVNYYPRMDGSTRITLAPRVANIARRIKINTDAVNLASGNYTLRVESFGSADGIYYGLNPSDTLNLPFTIVNSRYGLDISVLDSQKIINKNTGFTTLNNNILQFTTRYSSTFENPLITVTLYRRKYDEIYDMNYEEVDLFNYVTNTLQKYDNREKEYIFDDNPTDNQVKKIYLRSTLTSGTYKFVFKLYDDGTFIGDCVEYVIIK